MQATFEMRSFFRLTNKTNFENCGVSRSDQARCAASHQFCAFFLECVTPSPHSTLIEFVTWPQCTPANTLWGFYPSRSLVARRSTRTEVICQPGRLQLEAAAAGAPLDALLGLRQCAALFWFVRVTERWIEGLHAKDMKAPAHAGSCICATTSHCTGCARRCARGPIHPLELLRRCQARSGRQR